jgi:HTH-type transcriptional regulator/antitoxin HigA
MQIKPIHTEKDYEMALSRIEKLMDASPGSSEEDELEILGTLVEAYEEKHFPIEEPDPIEAIKFRMEQLGIENHDLATIIKSGRGRVSEILNKKRPLTLNMIRILNKKMKIPSSILISEYPLKVKYQRKKHSLSHFAEQNDRKT